MIKMIHHALLWGALVSSMIVFMFHAWSVYSTHKENELISQLISGKDVDVSNVIVGQPELRLARAYYFKQQHRYDEALATLSLILNKGNRQFQAKARYNLGNLYLEQAVQHAEALNMNEALPLAGLAKQAYRQALALNSQNWDAKYNLEVAMRLLPEMDMLSIPDDSARQQKSQLWTTVPGFPRGLP